MPQAEQTLATRAYKLTNYGVEFSRPLTADEFEELGYVLTRITNSLPWLWGDWLLAGEAAWEDEARYRLASSISGQPRARLAAFLRVAVSYRHADRLYAPWPYYCAALRLPESHRLAALRLVPEHDWTFDEFVAFVRRQGGAIRRAARARGDATAIAPTVVECPRCGTRFGVPVGGQEPTGVGAGLTSTDSHPTSGRVPTGPAQGQR